MCSIGCVITSSYNKHKLYGMSRISETLRSSIFKRKLTLHPVRSHQKLFMPFSCAGRNISFFVCVGINGGHHIYFASVATEHQYYLWTSLTKHINNTRYSVQLTFFAFAIKIFICKNKLTSKSTTYARGKEYFEKCVLHPEVG
jgi:hypothetical protein